MSCRISGVPRMTQTMRFVRALMGRKAARARSVPPGALFPHGAESHHQAQGQGEEQRQEKELGSLAAALQDGEGNSPEHGSFSFKSVMPHRRPKAESGRSLPSRRWKVVFLVGGKGITC